jgi:formylglycine-generating enzyme required for sulfatase activity
MILDLTQTAGDSGQITYVYETDLTNDLWGAWVRNPVTNNGTVVESVIWTGVNTNDLYKTNKLVLRRIHAGTFGLGPSAVSTALTKDFYAGVFEVTEAQWAKIKGGSSSTYPIYSVSYNDIRGATNGTPVVNWPSTKDLVSPSSFVGQLRSKTGLTTFDLPTCAQWEYLCRAGTTSYYNDGASTSSVDTNILNRLAWWSGNSSGVRHVVGGKEPNAWGLYDTLGGILEACLDWAGGITGAGPDGPDDGSLLV